MNKLKNNNTIGQAESTDTFKNKLLSLSCL